MVGVGNVRLVDMEGQEIEAGSVSGAALGPPWISLYLPLILK